MTLAYCVIYAWTFLMTYLLLDLLLPPARS